MTDERDEFLKRVLAGEAMLIEDGGMGTMLQACEDEVAQMTPAEANLRAEDRVRAVHAAYVQAGSQLVMANSFTSNGVKLADAQMAEESTRSAMRIAQRAISEAWDAASGFRPFLAADMGPTGQLLEPYGDLEPEEAFATYAAQAVLFKEGGAEIVCVETMTDLEEARQAVAAVRSVLDVPIFATMSFQANGHTFMGVTPEDAVAGLVEAGANAVGINCSLAPHEMVEVVARMAAVSSVPIIAKPNAGLPKLVEGQAVYDLRSEDFAQQMEEIVNAGATILGGCCGTTPDHIRALRQRMRERRL